MKSDYVVVGAGLTGAVVAQQLHAAGKAVIVIERRPHVGGQCYDYVHPSGIRVHAYGPHYFRTDSIAVWRYCRAFSEWYPYSAIVRSAVNGCLERWPVGIEYIHREVPLWREMEYTYEPADFEDQCARVMPNLVFERFVRGYTEKQWGKACKDLSPDLAKRFSIRHTTDPRLFTHRYQGLPVSGYTQWIENMLQDIPVVLNHDYLTDPYTAQFRALVFTGPIDEFWEFSLGHLKYRSQKREHVYFPKGELQPVGQVNYPSSKTPHIRSLEWKHMANPAYPTPDGTVLTLETPYTPTNPDEYEYPFPDRENQALYQKYIGILTSGNVVFAGRLGTYQYIDMDTAIRRAWKVAEKLLECS